MKFDDLFQYIGDFGRYQKFVYFAASSIAIAAAFQNLVVVFSLAEPKSRCAVPGLPNDTYKSQGEHHEQLINLTIPWETGADGIPARSKCTRFHLNATDGDVRRVVECDAWVYDKTLFDETVTSEFNLVCKDKQKQPHAKMAFFGGMVCGVVVSGGLSDRFGRKKILIGSILLHVAFSVGICFSPKFYVFAVLRFLIGVAHAGLYATSFVIGMELVGPSKRTVAGTAILIFWSLGLFVMGGLAFGLRNWRHLHLAVSTPNIIFVILYWLLPESPRWLLQKEKYEEAEIVIRKAAKVNKVQLPKLIFDKDTETKTSTNKILDLFTSPTLVFRYAIVFFNWLTVSLAYYGLSLNVSNLSGNIYINFQIGSVVETISYVVILCTLHRIGPKKYYCVSMAIGGVACILTIFPVMYAGSEKGTVILVLAMTGKMAVSAAYALVYIFSAELFPTFVRHSGIAWGIFFSKIGSVISPYVADLDRLVVGRFAVALPLLVFGGLSIMSAILSLWLPETLHKPIPDTVDDAKLVGRKNPELVGHVPKTHTTESDKDSKERCLLAENIKDNSCEENTTHTDLITTVV